MRKNEDQHSWVKNEGTRFSLPYTARFSSFLWSLTLCRRLTAYWEYDLSVWDIAAGALLVQEAGGKFTDLDNNPYNLTVRKMLASNGLIHDQVLDALREGGIK